MLRQFLTWAETASAGERADAAGDLARICLYAEFDPVDRGEMVRAMTALLDDPSPLVRRTLAEALAGAAHAPHHLVAALANDQADIAALVLGRSPILTDAELIDAAALGEAPAQGAIAARPGLSAAVAGALAEVGSLSAVLALCGNHSATLADVSIQRILERFGHDGELREVLGARRDLGVAQRHAILVATAEALRRFVTACGWMAPERARRVVRDSSDRATLALACGDAERGVDPLRFVAYLRRTGHLTPALVMRALMSGQTALFEAALAELSGQPLSRVSGIVRRHDGLAFAALVRSAGLPESLLPVLRTALDVLRPAPAEQPALLRRDIVAEVLVRCGIDRGSPVTGLTALLRRFEAEAVRAETRTTPLEHRPAPVRGAAPAVEAQRRIEPRFDAVLDLADAA